MRIDMSSEGKVIQTRVDDEEYERFRRVAEAEGLSLKEALRAAAVEFSTTHGRHDPDDPFFEGIDGESEDSLSATETEAYLYGEE